MMLIILRIVFGAALFYCFGQAWENAERDPQGGDITNAFWLAVGLLLALANAAVWAPFVGARLSEPLTGVLTRGSQGTTPNYLLRLMYWLEARRWRRLTLGACFLEGVHRPGSPAAFVLGLRNARPGSWLEKVFAREVFRFDNAQHCLEAYFALRRHQIDPRPHFKPEINRVLMAIEREARPGPPELPLPPAEAPAPLKRCPQIRLFAEADSFGKAANAVPDPDGTSGTTG